MKEKRFSPLLLMAAGVLSLNIVTLLVIAPAPVYADYQTCLNGITSCEQIMSPSVQQEILACFFSECWDDYGQPCVDEACYPYTPPVCPDEGVIEYCSESSGFFGCYDAATEAANMLYNQLCGWGF